MDQEEQIIDQDITSLQGPRKRKPRERNIPCTCAECTEDFMGVKGQKFCSTKCRLKYFNKNKLGNVMNDNQDQPLFETPEPSYMPVVTSKAEPQNIPYHAKYVIEHQKDQIGDLKEAHKKAEELVAKYKAECETLRNELAERKIDEKINASKGPTGLNGLMESSVMKELMPHIGPALGKIAEKLANAVPMPGQNTEKQLAGPENPMVQSITEWFIQQPEELQAQVFDFMNKLASMDPGVIPVKLAAALTSLNGLTKQNNGAQTNFRFG